MRLPLVNRGSIVSCNEAARLLRSQSSDSGPRCRSIAGARRRLRQDRLDDGEAQKEN